MNHSQSNEYQQSLLFLVASSKTKIRLTTKCIFCGNTTIFLDRENRGSHNLSKYQCQTCNEIFLLNDEETKSTRSIKELLCK